MRAVPVSLFQALVLLCAALTLSCATTARAQDHTPPADVTITAPLDGAHFEFGHGPGAITGKAHDNRGDDGIASVSLLLTRDTDGFYWNGSTFVRDAFPLPTALATPGNASNQGTNWSYTGALPTVAGTYHLTARAFDRAGNGLDSARSTYAIRAPARDLTPPIEVTIATPSDNAFHNFGRGPRSIAGKARDNPGGGGIASVSLFLRRATDGFYWNHSTFVRDAFPLPTGLSNPGNASNQGTNWSYTGALPTVAGTYRLTARAFDRAGNRRDSARSTYTIRPGDRIPPIEVTITSPLNGAGFDAGQGPRTVIGKARDNPGGSGIASVSLFLRRATGFYWNGSTFVRGAFPLPTALSKPDNVRDQGTTWSSIGVLPTAAGTYRLTARAFDRAGNHRDSAATSYTIRGTGSGGVTSPQTIPPVALSSASAGAASASVQLTFTGSLQDTLAGDPVHYTVAVNGQAVAVESAAYNARSNTVTLGLPAGSLQVGDGVLVSWSDLRDGHDSAVTGQTGPLTAR